MYNKKFIKKDNLIIIKPDDYSSESSDCPICNCALRDKNDFLEIKKSGCCTDCLWKFMYPNMEKWKNGWRPSKTDLMASTITKNGE